VLVGQVQSAGKEPVRGPPLLMCAIHARLFMPSAREIVPSQGAATPAGTRKICKLLAARIKIFSPHFCCAE
jgi:hypothetical protein